MLQYYLPGLDTSALDEYEFISKVGHLLLIREMEKTQQVETTLKNLFGRE